MADGKVTIDTELNNKGLNKGLKDSGSKLKDFAKTAKETSKGTNALSEGMKELATSALSPVASITATIATLQKLIKSMREANLAYREQSDAETMLSLAIKNNPYYTGEAEERLKNYAIQMQKVAGISDNEILASMQKLIANGRKEAEVFDIINAGLNLAVKEGTSLDTATDQLNATYSGMAGTLGRHNVAIKDLTQEQLKNGEAVRLVSQALDGYAEATANADAKTAQAKRTFNEAFGKLFDPTFEAWDKFWEAFYEKGAKAIDKFGTWLSTYKWKDKDIQVFTDLITGINDSGESGVKIISDDDLKNYIKAVEKRKEADNELLQNIKKIELEIENKKQNLLKKGLTKTEKRVIEDDLKRLEDGIKSLESRKQTTAENEEALIFAKAELSLRERIGAEEKRQAKIASELAKAKAKQKERDEKAQEHIDSVTKALADQLEAMRLNAELRNEEVDTAEELNAYMSAYVDLVVKSNGLVTENNTVAKNMLGTIEEMAKAEAKKTKSLKEQAELKEAMKEFYDFLGELQDELSEIDFYKNQIKELEKRKDDAIKLKNIEADEKLKIEKEFAEAKAKLDEKITQLEKEQQRERIDNYISIAKEFADEYANAMNNITRLASEGVEARAYLSTKEAEKMYNDGEIGYEEYQEKLSDIEKESAKQRYKIAMWEWGAQLVQAIANTAQGITKAIAQGGVAGIALGALVGAAGAAQIALITANKPVAPSFATGGIVGGTSYTGDRVQANVNSGEMILTYAQQKRLFDIANGGRTGGNVQVFNSASNDVNVRPEITPEGVRILIRKVVNEDMASGRYNKSYKQMRGGLNGVRLTN
jgi:hypothetical protein